jgi:hypothetical protein
MRLAPADAQQPSRVHRLVAACTALHARSPFRPLLPIMARDVRNCPSHLALLALASCATLLAPSCGIAVEQAPAPPAPSIVREVERNDTSPEANDLGWIKPGDALDVRGAVGPAAWDPYDGFTLRAWSDLQLVVELTTYDSSLIDLHIHDPLREETVASFGCGCGVLQVELDVPAGAVFQLVVGAWQGSSNWRLRIAATGAAWIRPPDGPRAAAGAHAVDTQRAREFGASAEEAQDDSLRAWPIGHAALRTPDGRLELRELRLHPAGVVLAPAR